MALHHRCVSYVSVVIVLNVLSALVIKC